MNSIINSILNSIINSIYFFNLFFKFNIFKHSEYFILSNLSFSSIGTETILAFLPLLRIYGPYSPTLIDIPLENSLIIDLFFS